MGLFGKKDRFADYPLTPEEVTKLATFNSEHARGLIHFPGYAFEMAKLQARHDDWTRERNRLSGYDDWTAAQPTSVRVSSAAPYVTGGASVSQEELDRISEDLVEGSENGHA